MAENVTLLGVDYPDVPSVVLPKTGGGTAQFDDTTIASNAASASDIASGKKAYVNGNLLEGTAQPMTPIRTTTVTDFLTASTGVTISGSCTTYGNVIALYLNVKSSTTQSAKWQFATLKSGYRPSDDVYGTEWNTGNAVEVGTNGSLRLNNTLYANENFYMSAVFIKL